MRFRNKRCNVHMDDKLQLPLVDVDRMKQQIAEAIRAAIRERAGELGMTYEDFINSLMKNKFGASNPA